MKAFGKKQYRLELRDHNDDDLDFELLGMPADSDWVLNGPWVDKSLIRNSFAFDLGNALGVLAPRTRHVEVFLNDDGGDVDNLQITDLAITQPVAVARTPIEVVATLQNRSQVEENVEVTLDIEPGEFVVTKVGVLAIAHPVVEGTLVSHQGRLVEHHRDTIKEGEVGFHQRE